MEGQGSILKTLLITAAVYTLALGVPVKRDTSDNTVIEICAAAKDTMNWAMCSSANATEWSLPSFTINPSTYTENSTVDPLRRKLQNNSFWESVCEVVRKCLNSSDVQDCRLAAAAIRLQDTIRRFVVRHEKETHAIPNVCNECTPPAVEVEVEHTLCRASVYILDLLDEIKINGKAQYISHCSRD